MSLLLHPRGLIRCCAAFFLLLAAVCAVFGIAGCTTDSSAPASSSSSEVAPLDEPNAATASSPSSTLQQGSSAETSLDAVAPAPVLRAESPTETYSYDDLCADARILAESYPQWVTLDSLGTSFDGRDLVRLVIGNPQAENQVLVHAGIHAREYHTTQLAMRQAAAFLAHAQSGDSFGDTPYAEALESNAVHLVPSINPDGAAISQFGLDGLQTDRARNRVAEVAVLDGQAAEGDYLRQWKANANGVDLNRNFDALWGSYVGSDHPSSERYKGTSAASEPESLALVELTERVGFSRTISYHSHGSVIYWYFGQEEPLYSATQDFASEISCQTGYPLDANFEALDPAGYKDWALASCGIPSLTVEVGVGPTPVPADQFDTIWRENEHVWEAMLGM